MDLTQREKKTKSWTPPEQGILKFQHREAAKARDIEDEAQG